MFIEVIMGWKHISKLHQIYVPSKECVGECIDGIKYPKILYVESLTTGMENHSPTVTIKLEWKIKMIKKQNGNGRYKQEYLIIFVLSQLYTQVR